MRYTMEVADVQSKYFEKEKDSGDGSGFNLAFKEERRKAKKETEPPKNADQRLNRLNTNPKLHLRNRTRSFSGCRERARRKPNPNKQNKVFPDKIKGFSLFLFPLRKKKSPWKREVRPGGYF
ncbi:hypothetical protein Baya_6400 [Bagarius yarrelli]|uniref:Uncharacterized protein n=1 Tax=Bagarius yarrelli TaxID=175774 RepID=A0A556U040_BAGYA|nr:hypothetical protein Baya_6400 [Bagarius yarrelli]